MGRRSFPAQHQHSVKIKIKISVDTSKDYSGHHTYNRQDL